MTKSKCFCCKKKIGMMGFECKCNEMFCNKCRLPEVHNCAFDHKLSERNLLNNKLVKVIASKIEKI